MCKCWKEYNRYDIVHHEKARPTGKGDGPDLDKWHLDLTTDLTCCSLLDYPDTCFLSDVATIQLAKSHKTRPKNVSISRTLNWPKQESRWKGRHWQGWLGMNGPTLPFAWGIHLMSGLWAVNPGYLTPLCCSLLLSIVNTSWLYPYYIWSASMSLIIVLSVELHRMKLRSGLYCVRIFIKSHIWKTPNE